MATNRDEMMPRVLGLLREKSRFLVTGHEMVDGDSTGCEVALHAGLGALGKKVRVVNNEPILDRFRFVDEHGVCGVFDPATFGDALAETEVVIVVDNNSWPRLANLEQPVRDSGLPVVCVDHHQVMEPFSELHLFDTKAAATGELVHDILEALGAPMTPVIARALYTTLCTDTGWFRYSNTSSRTFEICSRLLEHGIDPEAVNGAVNYQDGLEHKRLMSRVWEKVRLECGGSFAWGAVTQAMARDLGVPMRETDTFIDQIRSLKGVKIAALFKELRGGEVKVSLRSRENFSAHEIAAALGGGGHRHASGVTIAGSLFRVIDRVTKLVAERATRWDGGGESP